MRWIIVFLVNYFFLFFFANSHFLKTHISFKKETSFVRYAPYKGAKFRMENSLSVMTVILSGQG